MPEGRPDSGLYLRPKALKLGAFGSKAERETGERELGHHVLCLFLERGPQLSSEPQRRHGSREGWEPLSLGPLSSTPISHFSSTPVSSRSQGQTLVTEPLKAELPEAVALDGALVDEGASGGF